METKGKGQPAWNGRARVRSGFMSFANHSGLLLPGIPNVKASPHCF